MNSIAEAAIICTAVGGAALFMVIRIAKILKGKRSACCSGDGNPSCPHCRKKAGIVNS
ncbi:MAG: hypothetical protein LBQ88_00685 [Treponema sp.]|nr:hypothetical protein [Treponema sp.]